MICGVDGDLRCIQVAVQPPLAQLEEEIKTLFPVDEWNRIKYVVKLDQKKTWSRDGCRSPLLPLWWSHRTRSWCHSPRPPLALPPHPPPLSAPTPLPSFSDLEMAVSMFTRPIIDHLPAAGINSSERSNSCFFLEVVVASGHHFLRRGQNVPHKPIPAKHLLLLLKEQSKKLFFMTSERGLARSKISSSKKSWGIQIEVAEYKGWGEGVCVFGWLFYHQVFLSTQVSDFLILEGGHKNWEDLGSSPNRGGGGQSFPSFNHSTWSPI